MKACYYEVLEVSETCGDDDLKKSYRRLALLRHPDKNKDDPEANRNFQLLQEAYECLSDPNERAWYNSHKNQILGGGGLDEEGEDPSKIDLWAYFSNSCYTEFSDTPHKGFYHVYRNLFQSIVDEQIVEVTAVEARTKKTPPKENGSGQKNRKKNRSQVNSLEIPGQHISDEEESGEGDSAKKSKHIYNCTEECCFCSIPSLGNENSEWTGVAKFYAYWEDFCSARTFRFADTYNLNEAENRFVRRRMEAENLKLRKVAKREYNLRIRHLVALVKKRDQRVLQRAKQLAEASRKNDEEQVILKAKVERLKQINREKLRLQEQLRWESEEKERQARKFEEGIESESEGSESEEELFLYSCELCKKNYKSLSQWEAHAVSKKHKKMVQKNPENNNAGKKPAAKNRGSQKNEKKVLDMSEEDVSDEEEAVDTDVGREHGREVLKGRETHENMGKGEGQNQGKRRSKAEKKAKMETEVKQKKQLITPQNSESEESDCEIAGGGSESSDCEGDNEEVKKEEGKEGGAIGGAKGEAKIDNIGPSDSDDPSSTGEDILKPSVLTSRVKNWDPFLKRDAGLDEVEEHDKKGIEGGGLDEENIQGTENEEGYIPPPACKAVDPQVGASVANQKDEEVTFIGGQNSAKKKKTKKKENKANKEAICSTCKQVFGSRTKLFEHLKESGHAVPLRTK